MAEKRKFNQSSSNNLRNEHCNISYIMDDVTGTATFKPDEDQTDSIDSGCEPDIIADVSSSLINEYNFSKRLLQHVPSMIEVKKRKIDKSEVNKKTTVSKLKILQEELIALKGKKNNLKKSDVKEDKSHQICEINEVEKKKDKSRISARKKRKPKKPDVEDKNEEKNIHCEFNENSNFLSKPKSNINLKPTINEVKQVYNNCGKLVFSKFDFTNTTKDRFCQNKKGPDLNHYLNKLLKEKEKVEWLKKESRKKEALSYIEKNCWDNALQKLEGVKVKDDIGKINRSLRRKLAKKEKSKKKWNERINLQTQFKEKQEKIKRERIANRNQKSNNKKKIKKWPKKRKGGNQAGF